MFWVDSTALRIHSGGSEAPEIQLDGQSHGIKSSNFHCLAYGALKFRLNMPGLLSQTSVASSERGNLIRAMESTFSK